MTAIMPDPPEPARSVVAAAEQLLAKRYGVVVRLTDPEDLGGSGQAIVLRVRVAESPIKLSRTLIIKQIHDRESAPRNGQTHVESFLREAVSYQFANSLDARHRPGPELLAHDLDQHLLILSDLGDVPTLGAVVQEDPEADATNVLMGLAQSLGRMHAATAGRSEDFGALLRRARSRFPMSPVLPPEPFLEALREAPRLLADRLGVATPAGVQQRVNDYAELLTGPSYRAFSPGDLCPDNIVVSASGIRFLDYESGGFRDATLDLGCLLVSFPQCSCDLGLAPEQADAMVDAWLAEVEGVWPQLREGNLLRDRLLAARTVWVWLSTAWHLPDDYSRRAAEREHSRARPATQALASRWAGLALAADAAGTEDLARHATEVMDALSSQRAPISRSIRAR
ncbi:phosphotransferase family protein [Lolliginicoccus suaedae]|uniref:phosphotransferase family protein n=1 Tax=Lolliginicoccus suaedae TaxID=2605429 RepID=UPI0011F016F3|nr:kinase [Lolliginicoccus suaedae]